MNLNMSTYKGRMMSFDHYKKKWPHHGSLSAENMSKSGFYFLGTGDSVRCYYCSKELQYWEADDVPFEEHKNHQLTCPFVKMFSEPPTEVTLSQAIELEINRRMFLYEGEYNNLMKMLTR